MCHLSIAIDQSVHTLEPVFDLLEDSTFYVRSVRLAPVAWSRKADVYLSLGGGSKREFDMLLGKLRELPAVRCTQHTIPSLWTSATSEERDLAIGSTQRWRTRRKECSDD